MGSNAVSDIPEGFHVETQSDIPSGFQIEHHPQLKSIYPDITQLKETNPYLGAVAQTGQDITTIPAHFINQLALNYPRSLTQVTGYKYPEDTTNPTAGIMAKTAGVIGAIQNPLAKALGLGEAGTSLLGNIGAGAVTGATYAPTDNPIGLKERGIQSLIGGLLPVGVRGASKLGELIPEGIKNTANSIVQSSIKNFPKYARYGANPAEAVTKEGITGNSAEEIQANLSSKRAELGQQKGAMLSTPENINKTINITDLYSHIDDALSKAEQFPETNKALITRLEGLKSDIEGSIGKKNDLTQWNPFQVDALKQKISDLTKFTGAHSDDTIFNTALKRTYGMLSDKVEQAVPEIGPLNKRFANVATADNAMKQGNMFAGKEGQILNIGSRAGIYGGLFGLLTGNLPLAGAGTGEYLMSKAAGSPAIKSNLAKGLYKTGQGLETAGSKTSSVIQDLIKKIRG